MKGAAVMSEPADSHRLPDSHTVYVQGLFVKHATALRGFLYGIMPTFDHVDDIIHETFLTVTEKASTFMPDTNFLAWITAIARYKALEAARRDRRVPRLLSADVLDLISSDLLDDADQRDRMTALNACLKQLSPRIRSLLDMRYSDALSPGNIALRLNLTAETVYASLSRARATVRKCVEKRLAIAD